MFGTASYLQLLERDLEVLRQRWDEGKARGRAGLLDIKRLIAEERERLDAAAELRQEADIDRTRKAGLVQIAGLSSVTRV